MRANPDAPQAKKYRDSVEALRRASVAMAIQTSPLHSLASVVLELGFAALVMVVCYGSVNGDMSNMVALLGLVISLNLYRPYQELMDLSTYRHLQGHIVNRISQIWDIELLSEGNLGDTARGSHRHFQPRQFRPISTTRKFCVMPRSGPDGRDNSPHRTFRSWEVDCRELGYTFSGMLALGLSGLATPMSGT